MELKGDRKIEMVELKGSERGAGEGGEAGDGKKRGKERKRRGQKRKRDIEGGREGRRVG